MIVVGLETSSPTGGVALMIDGVLVGSMTVTSPRGISRLILPALQSLLAEASLTMDRVDVVATTVGPGAFTGVRVGLSIAKGLCASGSPKLVTMSTLEALAWRAVESSCPAVVPMMNARQEQVYAAVFEVISGWLRRATDDLALTPAELAPMIPTGSLLAGDGALAFRDHWTDLGVQPLLARGDRLRPSAESVALLGWLKATTGDFTDPATAAAVYLRPANVSRPKSVPGR